MNITPLSHPCPVRANEQGDTQHNGNVRFASSRQREMSSLRQSLDKLGAMPKLSARAACRSGRSKHERQH